MYSGKHPKVLLGKQLYYISDMTEYCLGLYFEKTDF